MTKLQSSLDKSWGQRHFRADLALTGVLFNDRLDADINFRVGPGQASGCRLQDANDAERMQFRKWGAVIKRYWP